MDGDLGANFLSALGYTGTGGFGASGLGIEQPLSLAESMQTVKHSTLPSPPDWISNPVPISIHHTPSTALEALQKEWSIFSLDLQERQDALISHQHQQKALTDAQQQLQLQRATRERQLERISKDIDDVETISTLLHSATTANDLVEALITIKEQFPLLFFEEELCLAAIGLDLLTEVELSDSDRDSLLDLLSTGVQTSDGSISRPCPAIVTALQPIMTSMKRASISIPETPIELLKLAKENPSAAREACRVIIDRKTEESNNLRKIAKVIFPAPVPDTTCEVTIALLKHRGCIVEPLGPNEYVVSKNGTVLVQFAIRNNKLIVNKRQMTISHLLNLILD